jgi:hypothetical protein
MHAGKLLLFKWLAERNPEISSQNKINMEEF